MAKSSWLARSVAACAVAALASGALMAAPAVADAPADPALATGALTGTVTPAEGGALSFGSNIYVSAFNSDGSYVANAQVDAGTGEYAVSGLGAGDYRLQFHDLGNAYMTEYYNDKTTLATANTVSVITGATTPNNDVELALAGTITGIVSQVGDCPLNHASSVSAYAYNNEGELISSVPVRFGTYTLSNLSTGEYRVLFSDSRGFYGDQWSHGKFSWATSIPVEVTAGVTRSNVNAELWTKSAVTGTTITGKVSPVGGGSLNARSGVYVSAINSDGGYVSTAFVNTATGQYTVGKLGTGNYRLQFRDTSGVYLDEYFNDKATLATATSVAVTAGVTTANTDIELTLAGTISGTVSSAGGGSLDGSARVYVYAYSRDGRLLSQGPIDMATGAYTAGNLDTGDYRLYFVDYSNAYASEYYNDKETLETATPVAVTVGVATREIDTVLEVAPPAKPTAVAGNGQATVSVSADPRGVTTSFAVSASPGTGTCVVTIPATSCVIDGLSNGTAYTFTASASNRAGTSAASAASNPVIPTAPLAPPAPPAKPTVVAGNGYATVSVAAGAGGATASFSVSANPGARTCTVAAPSTSCAIYGLSNGTAYTFTASASNRAGTSAASAASNPVIPTAPLAPPAPPAKPTVVAGNGYASVSVAATGSGGQPASFSVYATPGIATCVVIAPATLCDVTGLDNGTVYTFRVTATNTAGTSGASAVSDAVKPMAPLAPPGAPAVTTVVAGDGQATVSVMAGSGGAPDSFRVSASPSARTCDITAPATSCIVSGLSNGTAHTFTVTAINAAGTSGASEVPGSFTPTKPPAPPTTPLPTPTPPATPIPEPTATEPITLPATPPVVSRPSPPLPVAQSVTSALPKKLRAKKDKKLRIAGRTNAGVPLQWVSKSARVCRVKGSKVRLTGKRGTCVLVARAEATPSHLALSKRYRIKVK
jgi:hypothetical protein